ncbi:hypothetical protein HDA45_005792 [Amycolatopsis umgeniensis]|uniref:Uncharacterized protein n=1 Tax=Amycolatopsis umgeniensis TaxID=336628 RepID=A0A841BA05_9PSEU|nr:hypothetical protein [Amycolatopsis umgeniensis]
MFDNVNIVGLSDEELDDIVGGTLYAPLCGDPK